MIKTSFGLGFVFALFSSIAGASPLETSKIQISSQVYAEDPCNFYYATRGAFSIEVDVAQVEAQLGQSVTEVEVIYGYFGRWTQEFQLNKNPQRVEMARSEDNASKFVVTFSDFLAKKGRFQHDGIDFLFRAELDGGEVVDVAPAGYAQFYSAKIPYSTAKCAFEERIWDSLSLGVAGPQDRR